MAIVEANPNLGAQIVADAKEYVLYSWSVQDQINPIAVAGAEGRHFWDYDGKRYLDFASQLVNVNIGHQHPKIIQAIKDQADQLCTIGPPMANESRSRLGRMLAEVTPGDLSVSFFTNGGAEANENAVKLARLVTGRNKIIARYRSYHGATNGAVTLTGDPRRWAVEPGMPGVVRMFDPYTYRCPAGHPDPCPVCTGAPHLEEILEYEGAHTVAAVILETVTGTNGIIPPPDGYLRAIREVCDRHGILLILDEVMAGFGRTGRWFACEHWDVVPDIITVAKGINSGYVPLGAMIARGEIVDQVREPVLPRRADVRRPSRSRARPRWRRSRRSRRRGSSRTPPTSARTSASRCAASPTASVDRRRPRARLLLGRRARQEPRDEGDARPVQRLGRGCGAGRPAGEGGARPGALPDDPLEHAHGRAAAHDHARRGRHGRRDPRRRRSRSRTSTSCSSARRGAWAGRCSGSRAPRKPATAAAVSSSASHRTVCPPGTITTSSSSPSASRWPSRRWSYGR